MAENVAVRPIGQSARKWIIVSALVGYILLLFFLFFFIDVRQLLSALQTINLSVYGLALASVIIAITFHSLVWFQILNSLSMNLGFRRTYVLYWVGVFVDNLVPGGWSGDLFKAYLLSKDPELEGGKAVASVVAKNLYEAIFNLGSMLLGLTALVVNYNLPDPGILVAIGGVIALLTVPLLILIGASFKPNAMKKLIGFLIKHFSKLGGKRLNLAERQKHLEKAVDDYHNGIAILLEQPRLFIKPMILSFFAWGFEILSVLLVFASLNQVLPFDKVIIARSIAGNVEAQGYVFTGYAQIITIGIYTVLDVNRSFAASVALLGGLVVFWLKTGISYAAFHCTVFSPCSNFVCRAIGVGGVAGNKSCSEIEENTEQTKSTK